MLAAILNFKMADMKKSSEYIGVLVDEFHIDEPITDLMMLKIMVFWGKPPIILQYDK